MSFTINKEHISLNQSFETAEEAIRYSGEQLVKLGFIKPEYIESMIERQKEVSVYIGNFVALPHSEVKKDFIIQEGIFITQVPDGVDFGFKNRRQLATIIVTVALNQRSQLEILQELAFFFSDIENVRQLSDVTNKNEFLEIINNQLF